MFGFEMMTNYDQRCVAKYDKDNVFVSTAIVTDAPHPYETAISHPDYNDGTLVIVEYYDSREDAQKGHNEWVTKMTAEKVPLVIKDISDCEIVQFGKALHGEDFFERNFEKKCATKNH